MKSEQESEIRRRNNWIIVEENYTVRGFLIYFFDRYFEAHQIKTWDGDEK
jgi:hypothetical protein